METETLTLEVDANTDNARRSLLALNQAAKEFGDGLGGALSDVIIKGEELDDVFRRLALSIANNALKTGLEPLQTSVTNGLQGLVGGLLGGGRQGQATASATPSLFASLGNILPFARGGVVAAPTFFPLNGGLGVAGEAGAEAILPLRRGADGRLGVASGNGGGGTTINVSISTPDAASFRRSEAQVTTMLARAVQRSRRTL